MKIEEIKTISVLGAGIMGHGIAQSFLMGGFFVKLFDIQEAIVETAKAHIRRNLELFHQSNFIKRPEIESAMSRLVTTVELRQAVEESDFIVEAAPENLELKQTLFQQVESFCRTDAIITSNTSSLTLKEIGVRVKNKERLVITHWFNPPHIVPTVEVVKGDTTSDETVEIAYQLLTKIKKAPVKINWELPGFLINRIQIAMAREVFDLYEKGVASAADIDRAVKGSFGFRLASIGPLLTADLGGLDLWLKVCENLLPHIQSSIEPSKTLKRLVSQGHTGIKSGKGFYDYNLDFSQKELDEAVQRRDREFLDRLKTLYWYEDTKE
ncbi:MAG: 3-hydroxyacyl-CoA dehydrogenase family protein [Thermodesulfobacteriota bacterium]|nr:3-hydroxyacyl-CoA dehydrogenase family protein [Deltaproteobacteria bacterium]MDI6753008.1 3-hydroxyacyl-CoA dehydrogenase family protein [Thermodesulfobacteriota bacterium]